jgi:hypothetical protein
MKMKEEEIKKVYKFIDDSARVLVGTLLKRVEVLDKAKNLTPELYKNLTKELIYENSRNLKRILDVYFKIGTVIFKQKPKNSSQE